MRALYLDFETRSRVDLRAAGAHRYAEDPSTEVMAAGWTDGDLDSSGEPIVRLWTPECDRPTDLLYHDDLRLGAWRDYVLSDLRVLIYAHNAEFERLILHHVVKVPWQLLPPSRFRCTAAQSARCGLPRGLERCAEALGLPGWDQDRKSRLIRKLTSPSKRTGEFVEPEDAPEEFDELAADCSRDALTCYRIAHLLPPLSNEEQAIWELTVEMNDRGVRVDLAGVEAADRLAEETRQRLERRWVELTGVPLGSPRARDVLGMPSLAKVYVRHALHGQLKPQVREALLLRQKLAKTSVRKLKAFQRRVSADGRLRGTLVYAGAERTARWSGSGVQPQNFPRGPEADAMETFHRALAGDGLDLMDEDALRLISEMLKGFILGPLLVGDYGQIEARDLFWLAGERAGLESFRRGDDLYSAVASDIYGHPVDKHSFDEELRIPKRQLGKIATLGCGYGLGWRTLQRQLDEVFDVQVDDDTAMSAVDAYRGRFGAVPELWGYLERLALAAVEREATSLGSGRVPVRAGMREFGGRRFLELTLPSGRPMYYFEPRVERQDGGGRRLTYFGRNRWKGGAWERVSTYGGMLTENVVQASSRDLLAYAMLALARAGYPLILTVHDEAVAEAPAFELARFKELMLKAPSWATGIPLTVDAHAGRRYSK